MKLKKIIFATRNRGKVREAQKILKLPLEQSDIELDEIQELDLKKVALHKLIQAFDNVKKPVIIDDISVSIDAWNGFPGPLIKWILEVGNGPKILLQMLGVETNRKATASLAVGFHDGIKPRIFIGKISGKIIKEARGENGFGWDPVFIPDGKTQTFAQMGMNEKNKISHRRKALDKLNDFLKSNYDI